MKKLPTFAGVKFKSEDYAWDFQNVWDAVLLLFQGTWTDSRPCKNSDGKAKFDILPEGIVLVENKGIKVKDIKAAEMVLEENKELAIEKWNEYFGKSVSNED